MPFFLWKKRESEEKGRANDNGRCFEVDKDIHYLSQSQDSSFPARLGRDKAGSETWRRQEGSDPRSSRGNPALPTP